MGQIYSLFGYGRTVNNNYQRETVAETFSCTICSEVLNDPVQCQNNEHYFCRKCITQHLENSEACPVCTDQLTLETLRGPSRIVAYVVSELKKPRCLHVSRGCTENIDVEDVLLHEQTCDYAPVVCSNEGCEKTVNKRDQESHETEECKFRKITCESCDEELVYVDYYKKHQCSLKLRKEIDEIKSRLDEITEVLKQNVSTATEHKPKPTNRKERVGSKKNVANKQIFIFGGSHNNDETGKSVEIFNWSTKTWTLIKNCLYSRRYFSYSFIYGKKIMICGGYKTESIEILDPSEGAGYITSMSTVLLPSNATYNGVLYEDRILTFNKDLVEISLESPGQSRILLQKKQGRYHSAKAHLLEGNVYIVGGQRSRMEQYDVVENQMKTLPPLPYKVSGMATVAYKDNIVIIGDCYEEESLNDVVMFNVTTHECKKLPSMLEKRSYCTTVIMGDVIVVMGGINKTHLNTVEYYVIGDSEWKELPAMNLARCNATACVYA